MSEAGTDPVLAGSSGVEKSAHGNGSETPSTAPSLKDRSLYINRELSWLEFNDRVLQLAEDESLPLMERVKFLAIWSSNLDEFFMIRVAGVHDQIEARIDARGPDGLSPTRTHAEISRVVREQQHRHSALLRDAVGPGLAKKGIRIVSCADGSAAGADRAALR